MKVDRGGEIRFKESLSVRLSCLFASRLICDFRLYLSMIGVDLSGFDKVDSPDRNREAI